MNQKTTIEDLLAAAQRQQTDQRRQQQLANLIDNLAAEEAKAGTKTKTKTKTGTGRTRIVTWLSIAASFLLIISIGWSIFFIPAGNHINDAPLLAQNKNKSLAKSAESAENEIGNHYQNEKENENENFSRKAQKAQKNENEERTTMIALGESTLSVTPHGSVVTEEQTMDIALGESIPSGHLQSTPVTNEEQTPHDNVVITKERTSTRLIANNNPPKQPQTKTTPSKNTSTDNDSPALAFFQNTGTSTSIDLKSWNL